MDDRNAAIRPRPASSVPFGRLLLLFGGICALGVAWLGIVAAAFSQQYQKGFGQVVGIGLPVLMLAVAMAWVSFRLWTRGFGQRAPRVLAALIAALTFCLAVWSMVFDPGDAIYVVPVVAGVGLVFCLMAAIGPR